MKTEDKGQKEPSFRFFPSYGHPAEDLFHRLKTFIKEYVRRSEILGLGQVLLCEDDDFAIEINMIALIPEKNLKKNCRNFTLNTNRSMTNTSKFQIAVRVDCKNLF